MSGQKLDTKPFKELYDPYMGYFKNNKPNFDRLLEMAQKDNAKFKQQFLFEAKQNIEKMGEMRENNIFAYKKLLDTKGINDAVAEKLKDRTYENLMQWYKEMTNSDQVLRNLAQQINNLSR
jgi:hypothetical protein